MTEHDEQAALIAWRNLNVGRYPELAFLYAIPNGSLRPYQTDRHGRCYSPVAKRLQSEGVQNGVPDLHLPVARGGFIGLWLEMKFGDNKPTREQWDWILFLRGQLHRVEICYSADEAIKVLEDYLAGVQPEIS